MILDLSDSCRPTRFGLGIGFVRTRRTPGQTFAQFVLDLHDRCAGESQRGGRRLFWRAVPMSQIDTMKENARLREALEAIADQAKAYCNFAPDYRFDRIRSLARAALQPEIPSEPRQVPG